MPLALEMDVWYQNICAWKIVGWFLGEGVDPVHRMKTVVGHRGANRVTQYFCGVKTLNPRKMTTKQINPSTRLKPSCGLTLPRCHMSRPDWTNSPTSSPKDWSTNNVARPNWWSSLASFPCKKKSKIHQLYYW